MSALPAGSLRRLSGFCNPSWDPATTAGAASHRRCVLDGCPCACHAEAAETPESTPDPLVLVGGSIPVVADPAVPEGFGIIGPPDAQPAEPVAMAAAGDRRVSVFRLSLRPWRKGKRR